MPKRFIRFNLKAPQSKPEVFLRDPNANFMVILEKKIFAMDKQLLAPSAYFQSFINDNKKSAIIHAHINPDFFQKILGCFYGIEAAFERHNIIQHILQILSLIKTRELDEQLKNDMNVNFQQYGLFNLFYLSRKLGMKQIQRKCLNQLIDEEFQQINYNKYDLFQLSPQLFTFVLKQHEKQRNQRSITGLDIVQIRQVVDQYCKTKNTKIDVQQIIKYGQQCLKQPLSDSQQNEKPVTRRKNATWANSQLKLQKKQQNHNESFDKQFLSQSKLNTFQQKQNQVMKIRLMNSNLQENNSKLAAQIKSIKNSMNQGSSKDLNYGVDDLQKKLKQFSQKSKNAQKRMQQLKNKILKINLQQQKSDNQQNGQGDLPKTVNNGQFLNNKSLQKFAVLQKQQQINSQDSDI